MNLTNHFLIATQSMRDPVFETSVVYLCEHSPNGALGIVINKPIEARLSSLFEQLDLKCEIEATSMLPIMMGGPVQNDRGFILHSPEKHFNSQLEVCNDVSLTTSRDILEALADGSGPHNVLVSVGYAGWDAGQLEAEIAQNGWFTVPADPNIIFQIPVEERYQAAMKLLGLTDTAVLSQEIGHA